MKRSLRPAYGFMIILLLILAFTLVACERPLQPEAAATASAVPTVDPVQPTVAPPPTPEAPVVDELPPEGGEDSGADGAAGEDGAGAEGDAPPEAGDTDTPTEEAPAEEGTYTVQAGDTLFSIAQSFGLTVDDLVAANGIVNPDILEVGQVLVIPVPGAGDDGAADAGDAGDTDGDTGDEAVTPEQVYVIQPGDTLGRIGQRFGFTAEEIAAYNNMAVTDLIYVGDELLIPPSDFSLPEEGEEDDGAGAGAGEDG